MRSYKNLSDHDFELLTAELLAANEGRVYEVFARGADRGIDLRSLSKDGSLDIVQCKHMEGSTFAQLRSSAKSEALKLLALDPKPSRYRFVTTKSLTAGNKTTICEVLSPWLSSDDDVLGAEDLELLLNRHPTVERSNIKLWLSSFAQLDWALHAATWKRSEHMLREIAEALPRFVDTGAFGEASDRLYSEKVLVLSGPPGIGKTSIARMLVAEAVAKGYAPIEISEDIEEANAVLDENSPQVFVYDDFLGATFLHDRLSKNEDKRLASFMRRCRRSKNTLFILTTREHILKQATSWYDELDRLDLPIRRLLIELKSYSRRERALILYNHLFHNQDLAPRDKKSIAREDGYLKIVDHPNYNPRIIEYATTNYGPNSEENSLLEFAIHSLDNPERLWEQAFTRQLDDDCRDIVLILSTFPSAITIPHLDIAFRGLAATRGRTPPQGALRQALRVLDDSFTRTVQHVSREPEIEISNPSVADFAGSWLRENPTDARHVIEGAAYFEQLEWLQAQVVAHSSLTTGLKETMGAALMRTFNAAPAHWLYALRNVTRVGQYSEQRLLAATRMRPDLSLPASGKLGTWWRNNMDAAATQWRTGLSRDLPSVLALASLLHEQGQLTASDRSAITIAAKAADTMDAWDTLIDVLLESPSAFDQEADTFAGTFEAWAGNRLVFSIEDIADLDEFQELERMAEHFGVSTESSVWWDAHETIENRPEEEWTPPEQRSHPPQYESVEANNDELRTLFAHLES